MTSSIVVDHEEGFGIAVCEAMACGLPVVAYNLPVFKEVFPEGLVSVKIGDYHSFSEAILELLTDKEKYDKLKSEAVKIALKYDWDDVAKKELAYLTYLTKNLNPQ